MSLTNQQRTSTDGIRKQLIAKDGAGNQADAIAIVSPDGRETDTPYGVRAVAGDVSGVKIIHKYGHNHGLGTTFVPVCAGGIWQTPQVSGATALRIKSGGDEADDAAGAGAREITVSGLDATGVEISETIVTNGITESAATSLEFLRLFTIKVTASGTYGNATSPSHVGAITIENASGGIIWGIVPANDFPHSRSQIGVYTVPLDKRAFITQISYDVDTSKTVDLRLLKRENILDIAPPYSAVETIREMIGVSGSETIEFKETLGPFPALTDIGFMGQGPQSPAASVDFIIRLEDV